MAHTTLLEILCTGSFVLKTFVLSIFEWPLKTDFSVSTKAGRSLKLGQVGSKTRSLGQILEHLLCTNGNSFDTIFLRLCQNACLTRF